MSPPIPHASTLTLGASKIAFKYVLENVLQDANVSRALGYVGIDDIISFVKLTDSVVDNLVYNDLDPTVLKLHRLKLGPIFLVKSFIHYVHFREETYPIGTRWLSITMNDFDQFRFNFAYICRLREPLSSLPPLPYVLDVPNVPDVLDVSGVLNAHDMPNANDVSKVFYVPSVPNVRNVPITPNVPKLPNVPNVPNVANIINVPDVPSINDVPDVPNSHEDNNMGPNIYLDKLFDVTIASDVPNVPSARKVPNAQVVPNVHDVPTVSVISYVSSMTDVLEVADVIDDTNIPNVTDIHMVSNVINVPYDSSMISDIFQVTTTRKGLKSHYCVDMEYDANDSLLLSTMSDDDSKNGMVNQKVIPIPKTRIVWDPGTFLCVVATPEFTRDTSSLDYDYKDFGLWGDAPKDEITFNGALGSTRVTISGEWGVRRFRFS
jgi:hypothetical protein